MTTPERERGEPLTAERVVSPHQSPDDVLRVEHVGKRFGPTTALRDINLHLRKGEVLGLLGDNGAGKSTLIKILSGFHKPDQGTMWLKGEPYEPKSVDDAREHGLDTVFQDLALIDELTVYQNLFLQRERVFSPIPLVNNARMKREARAALDEIGINIPRINVPVARLSGGQRQAIAVARTISSNADIILLDEPLAAMGAKEGAMILDLIARLKTEGRVSIIMILHNYVHVFAACDRVSLIQDGVIALDKPTGETSIEELTEIVVEEYRRARLAEATGNGAGATPRPVAGPAATGQREAGASAAGRARADAGSSEGPAGSGPDAGSSGAPTGSGAAAGSDAEPAPRSGDAGSGAAGTSPGGDLGPASGR